MVNEITDTKPGEKKKVSKGGYGSVTGNQNNERVLCRCLILNFAAEVVVFFVK